MSTSSPRRSIDSVESPQSPVSNRSAYPFPRSSSRNRYQPRRGSAASSISITSVANSVGGSLDISGPTSSHSSVREASQNAISSLLQPPIIRTGLLIPTPNTPSTFKAPTTRDIPPVTLSNIPRVEPAAFKDYLSRIGPLFETFQRARAQTRAEQNTAPKAQERELIDSPALSRVTSASSLLSPIEQPQPRRRSSAYARRRLNEPTPLSTIPNVYFEENFQLENPRTFDVVSERAEIVKPPPGTPSEHQNGTPLPPRKSLATNAILQEKLSWYMDTVEVHLINSISAASTSFFAALGSLRDLEHEAAECISRIQKLRTDLATLDQGMAMGGLEVATLRRRHENVRKLAHAVELVAQVVEQAKQCEQLVDGGEFDTAGEALDRLERLIAGDVEQAPDGRPLIDLRSLRALHGLSDAMMHLRARIGKGFESRFLGALLSDLRQHVEKVPSKDTLRRWASASQRARGEQFRLQVGPPAYMDTTEPLRKELLASLGGLNTSGQTAQAIADFREAVMKEMKNIIRKHLPSSNDDDLESVASVSTRGGKQLSQQEKSAILARNLRALDEESAEELFVNVYTGVSEALRRLSVQTKVLLDVTSSTVSAPQSSLNPPSSPNPQGGRARSPMRGPNAVQDELSQALDLSSLLGQAVDTVQTQITRILKVRTEQSTRFSLERFLRYFTLNRLFADECEAVSGRSGSTLKTIVNTQLTAFVHTMSERENQGIAQKLDSDQWEAKDFGEDDQALLSRILGAMSSDPAPWLQGTKIWEDMSAPTSNGTPAPNGETTTTTHGTTPTASTKTSTSNGSKAQPRPAHIDNTRFILVSSVLALLRPVESFLALSTSIPSISALAIPALADLLRIFNSRTSQLVLGAGATRIAGLKNITTKNLALASQALSFVVALVPYMREAVRRHAGGGAGKAELLAEFDKVKRLYLDHQMGIHDKLVEIMTARSATHVNAMKKVDFDGAAAEQASASPYMETLTKETATLHRVLIRHLAEPDVLFILGHIFNNYKEQWTKAFAEVRVQTVGGKNRLLRDADLFVAKLGKIDGFGNIGTMVVEAVKAKTISEANTAVAAAPAEKDSGRGSPAPAAEPSAGQEDKAQMSAEHVEKKE